MIRPLHRFVLSMSANINDRSMLGKRDSEIAAIIKDKEFVSLKSNLPLNCSSVQLVSVVAWVVRDTVGVVSCRTENSQEYNSRIKTRPQLFQGFITLSRG